MALRKNYNREVWRMSHTRESNIEYLIKINKVWNERMRQIRKKGYKYGVIGLAQTDYLNKMHRKTFPTSKNTIEKMSDRDIKLMIKSVQDYLNAKTGSASGIRKSFEKQAQTLRLKYHIDISGSEFYSFVESEEYKHMESKWGSANIMELIDIATNRYNLDLDTVIDRISKFVVDKRKADAVGETFDWNIKGLMSRMKGE